MIGARLVATATYGPAELAGPEVWLDNRALLRLSPTLAAKYDADAIEARFGVRRRQWVRGTALTEVELAEGAARRALASAETSPGDVHVLITATSTPSRATQSLAGRLAKRLGLDCASFDVRAGGAAGLLALRQAQTWLQEPDQTALVVAAEAISPWLDLESAGPASLLFGDGAAALVLRSVDPAKAPHSTPGCLVFQSGTHAPVGQPFTVPGRLPPQPGESPAAFRFQSGDREYAAALDTLRLRACADLAAAHAQLLSRRPDLPRELAAFFPFAPSSRSARDQTQALGLASERHVTALTDWGCPGAAAPFIALAQTPLPADSTLALCAVGGGVHRAALTWFQDQPLP